MGLKLSWCTPGRRHSCLPRDLLGRKPLKNWPLSKLEHLPSWASQKFSEYRVTWVNQIHEVIHVKLTNLEWETFLPRHYKVYVHNPGQPVLESEHPVANNRWTQMLSKGHTGAEERSEEALLSHSQEYFSNHKGQGFSSAHGLAGHSQVKIPWVFIFCSPSWLLPPLSTPFHEPSHCLPPGNVQFNWLSSTKWHSHAEPAFLWLHPRFFGVLQGVHISDGLLLHSHRWLITSIVCESY